MFMETRFEGLKALELNTKALRLVVVTEVGPRIAHLSRPNGGNLFFWDSKRELGWRNWKLMGGHRVWIARPGADESEETYSTDNSPCEAKVSGDTLTILSTMDSYSQTRKGLSIKVLDDDKLEVDNFLENPGPMLYSGSIWALTCTLPTPKTKYGFAVGDGSSWDCFTMMMFKNWAGHGLKGFNDPQFRFENDLMLVEPQGFENKRMLQSHLGLSAMSAPEASATFIKKVDYNPDGKYPLGCNKAVYVGPNNFMVEMETMGEERTVKPGARLSSVETWKLLGEAINLSSSKSIASKF